MFFIGEDILRRKRCKGGREQIFWRTYQLSRNNNHPNFLPCSNWHQSSSPHPLPTDNANDHLVGDSFFDTISKSALQNCSSVLLVGSSATHPEIRTESRVSRHSVNRHLGLGREQRCPFRDPTIVNQTLGQNFKKLYYFCFYASYPISR